jgi:FkbH-like protein
MEWSDLDPRLGYRGAGTWGPSTLSSILTSAEGMLNRIAAAIRNLGTLPVALALPTAPLPPLFHTPGWQASTEELDLRQSLLAFAAEMARSRRSVVSISHLDDSSPAANRFDLKSDLITGLPYSIPHADRLAEALALNLVPRTPKKGLITDLDDTLWRGLVGEIGYEAVSWDLSNHGQVHGLYQNLLRALSEEGVLIGIASKNDPAVTQKALGRDDLLLKPESVFPIEVHWNAKSASVGRILQTWNIGADSVVFVDDSPMELAEVAAGNPGITCIQFPKDNPGEAFRMLRNLRNLFGKPHLSEEDSYRLNTIRSGAMFKPAVSDDSAPETFLKEVDAAVTFDFSPSESDDRVLELVNKTNQFNLNGIRYTRADWNGQNCSPGTFVAVVSYQDKFGPLGKIAVLRGRHEGNRLTVNTWVMSCRAFSRRIEYQCLQTLYTRFGVDEIGFEFAPTAKNGPLQEFFEIMLGQKPDAAPLLLSCTAFERRCPPLYHRTLEAK